MPIARWLTTLPERSRRRLAAAHAIGEYLSVDVTVAA